MSLLFDTSVLINLENEIKETIEKLQSLAQTYPSPATITFINEFEFLFGLKDKNIKNRAKSIYFLRKFLVLHSSRETPRLLADLKYKYQKKGLCPPLADLIIACIAIENGKILVTTDKDFNQIEELQKIII